MCRTGYVSLGASPAEDHDWSDRSGYFEELIGWRFADKQKKPEPVALVSPEEAERIALATLPSGGEFYLAHPRNLGEGWKGYDSIPLTFGQIIDDKIAAVRATAAEPSKSTDNMGVSQPVIDEWKRREQEFHERNVMGHAKRQQEEDRRAGVLQEAAEAMDKAGDSFGHKFGAMR
jgi:hypothetical protein